MCAVHVIAEMQKKFTPLQIIRLLFYIQLYSPNIFSKKVKNLFCLMVNLPFSV